MNTSDDFERDLVRRSERLRRKLLCILRVRRIMQRETEVRGTIWIEPKERVTK